MRTTLLFASLFAIVFFAGVSDAQFVANGTNFHVSKTSAYCFYYSSSNININNFNTYINATSNNLYGYASVYVSSSLKLNAAANQLAICNPNKNTKNSCSTEDYTFNLSQSGTTQFVLVCLECHYYLGDCIFDDYYVEMTDTITEGDVDCTLCV